VAKSGHTSTNGLRESLIFNIFTSKAISEHAVYHRDNERDKKD